MEIKSQLQMHCRGTTERNEMRSCRVLSALQDIVGCWSWMKNVEGFGCSAVTAGPRNFTSKIRNRKCYKLDGSFFCTTCLHGCFES